MTIDCSVRTLYRQFKEKIFDEATVQKGNRKQMDIKNVGVNTLQRNVSERIIDYPSTFKEEFWSYREGDTIVKVSAIQSAVITLVKIC